MNQTMKSFPICVWDWQNVIKQVFQLYPERMSDFADSIAENQFTAKSWLVEILSLTEFKTVPDATITILGSWYGSVLVPLLFSAFENVKQITLIDQDPITMEIAKIVNARFGDKIKYITKNINADSIIGDGDLIINCSCEHMIPMKFINFDGMCVFQSNNFRKEKDHINCVDSTQEFINQSGLEKIDFFGEIDFHKWDDKHKRFMIIGK